VCVCVYIYVSSFFHLSPYTLPTTTLCTTTPYHYTHSLTHTHTHTQDDRELQRETDKEAFYFLPGHGGETASELVTLMVHKIMEVGGVMY
jgi:hypothetical protein